MYVLRCLWVAVGGWLATTTLEAGTRDLLKNPEAWFANAEAANVAANILSYQSGYGGWPKNFDLTTQPFAGSRDELEADFKPIFDNGATTDEVRFMARMYRATNDERYLRAVENGVDFILIAQYPTGGWPQSWPPDTTYRRHITFNDDAMVRTMVLLREIAQADGFAFLDADRRAAARIAFQRGVECIVRCQITVDGRRTAWCAQHDEFDFSPRPARRFELVSISGAESVKILQLLMRVEQPSAAVVRAIESAVSWLESARIEGWRVIEHETETGEGKNFEAVEDAAAGPLWARFYDLATNRPLFTDMDSVPRLGIENVGWARRGYRWTGDWAEALLAKEIPAWKARIAASGPAPAAEEWQPKARLALAGDSTVTDHSGWGFGFKKRVAAGVLCENFARGGQSSKSFRDTGWWDKLIARKPDFVLIQFGHNDMPGKGAHRETDPASTFAENLARYVTEARAIGAQPVLITSLTRRIFEKDGTFRDELAPYAAATRKVAAEQNVPLLDLHARSRALVAKLGPAGVESFEPKVIPKPPSATALPEAKLTDLDVPDELGKPRRDGTHLNPRGSIEFGAMVADELRRVLPEVQPFLR